MLRLLNLVIALAIGLGLSACSTVQESGRDFATVKLSSIVAGASTRAEMLALLGEPAREQADTYRTDLSGQPLAAPQVVRTAEYWFSSNDPAKPAMANGIAACRYLSVFLIDGSVAGVRLNSSFMSDSTAFDASKVQQITRGVSSTADVYSLIGKPGGTAVYPLAAQDGGVIYFYSNNRINLATHTDEKKWLTVHFGANQRVIDFSFSQQSTTLPNPAASAPQYMPARR